MEELNLELILLQNPQFAKSLPVIKKAIEKLAKLRAAGVASDNSFGIGPKSLTELKNSQLRRNFKNTFMLDRQA